MRPLQKHEIVMFLVAIATVFSLSTFVLLESVQSSVVITAPLGQPGTLSQGAIITMNPYTVNTTTTLAHGLGGNITFATTYLECLTTELGFAVGDRVMIGSIMLGDSTTVTPFGFTVTSDATNMVLVTHVSQNPATIIKTGRTLNNLTPANWKLVVVPYRIN